MTTDAIRPGKPQLLLTFEESGDIGIHSDGDLSYAQLFVAGALLTRMASSELDRMEFARMLPEDKRSFLDVAGGISPLRKVDA